LIKDYDAAQQSVDNPMLHRHMAAIGALGSVNRRAFWPAPAALRLFFPELPFSRGSFRTRRDAGVLRPRSPHMLRV
jgi:hypothetical protein